MAHVHRFYSAEETVHANGITLTGDEAHHALHVVRVRVGDSVRVFNGRGREWEGIVRSTSRHELVVDVAHERSVARPPVELTLFQSWLHRDKALDELVRRATEIGVSRFVFFRADRSERAPGKPDKWMRVAIESCKQCGRLWLPEFQTASCLADSLHRFPGRLLIADSASQSASLRDIVVGAGSIGLITGPEGDFTPAERAHAEARGATPISLGVYTYRSEVAAVLAATLILNELGEYRSTHPADA